MLRSLAHTLILVLGLGGVASLATLQLLDAQTRAQRLEGDVASLHDELDELRQRIDAPPSPPARPPRPGAPDPAQVYAVPIAGAPARGPADALVTIVAFTDYQCPFCARAEATLAQLAERYPQELRVVVQHNPLPFHKQAFAAAVAAKCAGEQGLFWPMHDRLFDNQRSLVDPEATAVLADGLEGLKRPAFERCLASEAAQARVTEDRRLAERFGARGTPTFFINGRMLSGAQPLERFVEAVERELAAARASDIPRVEYYRRAVLEPGEAGVR